MLQRPRRFRYGRDGIAVERESPRPEISSGMKTSHAALLSPRPSTPVGSWVLLATAVFSVVAERDSSWDRLLEMLWIDMRTFQSAPELCKDR